MRLLLLLPALVLPRAVAAAAAVGRPTGDDGAPLLSRAELLERLFAPALPPALLLQEFEAHARALSQPPQLWGAANASGATDDDLARAIAANTRVAPAALVRPDTARAVVVATPRGCNAAAVSGRGSCAALLSACLTRVVTDADGTCACYAEHSRCYRRAGCAELLPRGDVHYCVGTLHCSLHACEGSAAGAAAALAAWALVGAALLAGVAAVALPGG